MWHLQQGCDGREAGCWGRAGHSFLAFHFWHGGAGLNCAQQNPLTLRIVYLTVQHTQNGQELGESNSLSTLSLPPPPCRALLR